MSFPFSNRGLFPPICFLRISSEGVESVAHTFLFLVLFIGRLVPLSFASKIFVPGPFFPTFPFPRGHLQITQSPLSLYFYPVFLSGVDLSVPVAILLLEVIMSSFPPLVNTFFGPPYFLAGY